jgi:oleate hydratase
VAPEDIVLVTTGSQAADLSAGSMTEAPKPLDTGRSWALWKRLAQGRKEFGNPDAFFGAPRIADSRWVTLTVTTTSTEFIDQMTKLTGSEPGSGGLLTLKDSGWVLSLSIFHQPEVLDQPEGTFVWWGYGLHPEGNGNYVTKRMDQCSGAEILEEVLGHLRFDEKEAILKSSICIPCHLPYVNNIWLPRRRGDRPPWFQRGRPILESSGSTSRSSVTSRSPSNTPLGQRGKRSTSFSNAARRRRLSIRANTIRRRCSRP